MLFLNLRVAPRDAESSYSDCASLRATLRRTYYSVFRYRVAPRDAPSDMKLCIVIGRHSARDAPSKQKISILIACDASDERAKEEKQHKRKAQEKRASSTRMPPQQSFWKEHHRAHCDSRAPPAFEVDHLPLPNHYLLWCELREDNCRNLIRRVHVLIQGPNVLFDPLC